MGGFVEAVAGDKGRLAEMRTRWLNEAPGVYVALNDDGTPQSDPRDDQARVVVFLDGDDTWMLRLFTRAGGQYVGNSLDTALANATRQLHE